MNFGACCGGAKSLAGGGGFATLTLNKGGGNVKVPFREVDKDEAGKLYGDEKRRVIWNLDAVDVVTMFEQPDMVVPPDDSQDVMLQEMYTKLQVQTLVNSGTSLENAWSNVQQKQQKRQAKAEAKAAIMDAASGAAAETGEPAPATPPKKEIVKKEVKPNLSIVLPKVVRVYRYWTGYESSDKDASTDYWQKREARVIEIRHGSSPKKDDCWWFIVADGVPLRCMEHPSTVADKKIFNISFGVAEYVSEMPTLFDLEHPTRAVGDEQEQKKQQGSSLTGRTLSGTCKMRWSATKMKWSYAVEVNGCPVPAMWSKPVPGLVLGDFKKEETGNCPKSAYVPDVLCESKNLYTKEEIANSNGEYMHVSLAAREAKKEEKENPKSSPETGNPVETGGEEAAPSAAGTVALTSRKSASFLMDAREDGAPAKYEYKTVRVWRFTIDHELRGVEVAHENKIWYILVDGIEKATFDEKKKEGAAAAGTYSKDAKTKTDMWGIDFKVKRCKRADGRSEAVPEEEREDVDASMKMSWNRRKFRWEYLLIVNGTFVPQCGWKGSAVNPRDFCAVEVPEVSTTGDCKQIADAADSGSGAWRSLPWNEQDTKQKETQASNLQNKRAPTKTACIFNFTTKFRLRTVAVIHTGFKFTVSLDGKHVKDATHGSIPIQAMQCNVKFAIPLYEEAGDAEDIKEEMVELAMSWRPRKEFKWQYLLSIGKKVATKDKQTGESGEKVVWFRIEPTFDYGMAGGGKAVEVIDDTGKDLKLAEKWAARGSIEDEGDEAIPLPLETRTANAMGPEDPSVLVTEEHGFKRLVDGDSPVLVALDSDVKEIARISGLSTDGLTIDLEGRRALSGQEEEDGERKESAAEDRDFMHPEGTKIVLFETKFDDFLAEISARLRFHPGTVEMHQDSRNAIKTLASLLRYMDQGKDGYTYNQSDGCDGFALKIRGFTGKTADVFTHDRDLEFLGLKRADNVKSTLRCYLAILKNQSAELPEDPLEAELQDEAEPLEIGTEGVAPVTDIDSQKDVSASAFTCTIEKCANSKCGGQVATMRLNRRALTKKQELATAPKRFEITAKSMEFGPKEGAELRMELTTPMQAFVFLKDTVAPGRKVGKTKTTKIRTKSDASRGRGDTNVSQAMLTNPDSGDDGAAADTNDTLKTLESTITVVPRTESMDEETQATPVRGHSVIATDVVRNSNMHRPAYRCDGATVEFFSKTHRKWLAAVITKIRIEDTDQAGTTCTCFYDIEFSRNKQRRQFVAMDSLRLPLENNANVEVWSKKNGWIVGTAVGDPNSATTVGYTVHTDKGQFTKVPAERFRRRFAYAVVNREFSSKEGAAAPEVLYYTNAIEGWVSAELHPEVADGRSNNGDGKCLIKELTLQNDQHLQKIKTAGDQQEQTTGPDERSRKAEAEKAAAAAAAAGIMGDAVTVTPMPSGMPSVGASPATSLLPGRPLAEQMEQKDIEPWTKIPLLIPAADDEDHRVLREALVADQAEAGELEEKGIVEGRDRKKYCYVELWRIKAKPENWKPEDEEEVKVADPAATAASM